MIKYQGTPHDILLVQQDGWNGQNKEGCVFSLSHQHLPFFCPDFLSFPSSTRSMYYENMMDFILRRFSAPRRKHIFLSCTWCSCCPPSVSPLSLPPLLFLPPPPFFLLFYLRSLSEGLTISSSVSLLSCSAVYCLWFAQAHPCGCSFQQPSVTCWIEGGDPRRSSQPWATLILLTRDGLCARRRASSLPSLVGVAEAVGCGTWTLFGCRRQLSFCVKGSGPSRHYLRGKGKIDVLPPCFHKFNTSTPRSPHLSSL